MPAADKAFAFLSAVLLSLLTKSLSAAPQQDVDQLLAMTEPPVGVVFEIVSGNPEKLDDILTRIHGWTQALQERFASVPVIVISHGQEQFSLTRDALEENPALKDTISMIGDTEVPLMVCGNHASIRGVDVNAYPDNIDVVKAAPAAIRELRARRYTVVVISH